MKRVEITAKNVHTSAGKLLSGTRVNLPDSEAEQMMARGLADGVDGANPPKDPKPGATPEFAVELPETPAQNAARAEPGEPAE